MVTELLLLLRGVSNTCITGMNQLVHSLLSATSSPGKTLPSRQLAGPMTGLRLLDSRKKKCFTTIQLGRWSNQKRTAFIFSNGKNMLMAAHFTRWNSGTQAWEVRYLAACLCYQKTHTTLTTLGITVRALTINQLDSSNIITVQGLVEEPLDKMLQPPLHRSRTGLFPLNE